LYLSVHSPKKKTKRSPLIATTKGQATNYVWTSWSSPFWQRTPFAKAINMLFVLAPLAAGLPNGT